MMSWEMFIEKHVYKNPDVIEGPSLETNLQQMVDDLIESGAVKEMPPKNKAEWKAEHKDQLLKKQTKKESPYAEPKTVMGLTVQNVSHVPEELLITTAEALDIGIPVQIQLEIVPKAPVGYVLNEQDITTEHMYHALITSMQARVKPGTSAFSINEEKQMEHIINGTEDSAQEKKREAKIIERYKEAKKAPNRFTGLEI